MRAEAILYIKHWGNSLGLHLPPSVVREARLQADQRVRITVEHGNLVIRPVAEPMPSLAERLARFDPERHGGEVMPTEPLGTERW